jgi:hypothetical protein
MSRQSLFSKMASQLERRIIMLAKALLPLFLCATLVLAVLTAFAAVHAALVRTEPVVPGRARPPFSLQPRWLESYLMAHGAGDCIPEQSAPDVARRAARDSLRQEKHGFRGQTWPSVAISATCVLAHLWRH